MQNLTEPGRFIFSRWQLRKERHLTGKIANLMSLWAIRCDLYHITFILISKIANLRGGWLYRIGWILGKIPNGLRPPTPLIFGKLCCNFFRVDMVAYICKEAWWPDSMKCMHMISRNGTILTGEGWGSTAVCNLSENSSDLVAWPVRKKSCT